MICTEIVIHMKKTEFENVNWGKTFCFPKLKCKIVGKDAEGYKAIT